MNQLAAFPMDEDLELPVGTRLLNGQYQILHQLQKGGFAVTYLARDSLDRLVVIKECFPAGMCERVDGRVRAVSPRLQPQLDALKRQFVREARTLATLRHHGIVAVHQVFEENDSAYMALDFAAGIDLITLLEDQPDRLTPAFLESALRQALDAVRFIHDQGILHRDIAPDNIRVDAAGRITLIDFGAASRQAGVAEKPAATMLAVKDGYSPCEFYLPNSTQDPSSDLYSLAATFYHLITGEAPPNCHNRLLAIQAGVADPYMPLCATDWNCGYNILALIDSALAVAQEARPQSAEAWLKTLDEAPKTRPAVVAAPLLQGDLEAVVSQLVRDTNGAIAAPPQQKPRAAQRWGGGAAASPQKQHARKQWVDIVGAPITDIETWLQDQEKPPRIEPLEELAARAELAIPEEPKPAPEPVPQPVQAEAASATGFRSLFAGFSLRNLYRGEVRSAT